MRGADLLTKALAQTGVKTVFSLSGNQIMPVYDACIDVGIRLVHVRHEASAVFMADAWAQLTGEVGIALVTAAPGFGNGLGPLYTARASESPIVFLSGDAPVGQDGQGAFQELDQAAISAPLTKASFRASSADTLGHDIAKAIRIARSGRPGPVHVALPFDVLQAETNGAGPIADTAFEPDVLAPGDSDVAAIADALADASSPLVVVGPALNPTRSGDLLDRLSDALDAPVVPLESPRGLRDPSLGRISDPFAGADLVVSLGKAVDFTMGFGKTPPFDAACKWITVDPDTAEQERARQNLGDRLIATHNADAAAAAERLVAAAKAPAAARTAWRADVAAAVAHRGFTLGGDPAAARISPAYLCQAVQKQIDAADDAVLVADGGEFGQWAQACLSAPNRVINGPAGAIGGGLCYSLAASLARPGATVFSLMGDGTSGFHFSEFETAVRNKAPFVAIIGNDACWNAEHQIQMRDYGPDRLIGCELDNTRYDLAAEGLGCHGEHVTDPADLDAALERAVNSGLPACVNVEIEGQPSPGAGGH